MGGSAVAWSVRTGDRRLDRSGILYGVGRGVGPSEGSRIYQAFWTLLGKNTLGTGVKKDEHTLHLSEISIRTPYIVHILKDYNTAC